MGRRWTGDEAWGRVGVDNLYGHIATGTFPVLRRVIFLCSIWSRQVRSCEMCKMTSPKGLNISSSKKPVPGIRDFMHATTYLLRSRKHRLHLLLSPMLLSTNRVDPHPDLNERIVRRCNALNPGPVWSWAEGNLLLHLLLLSRILTSDLGDLQCPDWYEGRALVCNGGVIEGVAGVGHVGLEGEDDRSFC